MLKLTELFKIFHIKAMLLQQILNRAAVIAAFWGGMSNIAFGFAKQEPLVSLQYSGKAAGG